MKAKKGMFMACVCIVLALVLMAGATYALFTDEVKIQSHLVAGDLEIGLTRTQLVTTYLTSTGRLAKDTNYEIIDYSDNQNDDKNLFGMDASEIVVAPGCERTADMTITNAANVAFGYYFVFNFESAAVLTELVSQLYLTIDVYEGSTAKTVYSGYMDSYWTENEDGTANLVVVDTSDLTNNPNGYLGEVENGQAQRFTVTVAFVNQDAETNNLAQSTADALQKVAFDMTVVAEQLMDVAEPATNP